MCYVSSWPQGVAVALPTAGLSFNHGSLFSSTYIRPVYFICLCTTIHRNFPQLECIICILMSASALSYTGNNLFPPLSRMIDYGSLVQLMNICLVFMAFKCHERSRLALWISLSPIRLTLFNWSGVKKGPLFANIHPKHFL